MKGRRWAGRKLRTKETHRLIYQIVSITRRERKDGEGAEEQPAGRPETSGEAGEKRGGFEKKTQKTSAVAEGRKL